jgi:arginine decarboxylase
MNNLIPKDYFRFKGVGEAKHAIHPGSYHMALFHAGIHECNIMTYSSLIPACSIEMEHPRAFVFGQELKTIMAVMHGRYGERISAGIAFAPLLDDDDLKIGSIVVERAGHFDEDDLKDCLDNSLYELYNKTFNSRKMGAPEYIVKSYVPEDVYGTVIAGIGFLNYLEL